MNRERIEALLADVQKGAVSLETAVDELARLPFVDTVDARVDTHRALRQGIPEVVFGPGKSDEQIVEIVKALCGAGQEVLVTRIESEIAARVLGSIEAEVQGADGWRGTYDPVSRVLFFGEETQREVGKGTIVIVSAGTADLPVATEAAVVARRFGNRVEMLKDVGVAGIHRLLASQDVLRLARVLIVVAGMEGALPSVVGGMVDKPVIAVPTSVGYGASLGGLTALFGMLTSCASNVTVVNIDNGFGAAYAATLINRL